MTFRNLVGAKWVGAAFGTAAVATAVATMAPLPVMAQDENAEEGVIEEVVVTGSRIRRTNVISPVPMMSMGQEDVQTSGKIELSQIVRELPSIYEGTSTENSQSSTQNSGSATVELRNLGEDRTLVLIDGRRTVSNSSTDNVVSLDTIPLTFIERVEVITGGASAVYGSDAVTGVVNIITRNDFEGLEIGLRTGDSQHGGGAETVFELTGGVNFEDDRGNLMFNYTYDRGDPIRGRDRDWAVIPSDIDGGVSLSSNIPGGRFLGNDWFYHPETNELMQDFDADQFGYNDRPDHMIRIEKERNLLAVKAHYDLTDNLTATFHTQYAHVWTNSERAPDTASSARLGTEIPLNNPFIPQPILDQAIADGATGIDFRRRWTEIGPRNRGGDRDTTRIWGILEGDINDNWSFSAFYGFHEFRQAQNRVGDLTIPKFRTAVDVEPDPDNPGSYRCVDEVSRTGGCVPINVFGIGAVTPEAINWVILQDALRANNTEKNAGAYVTGDLFDLPEGPVSLAAGVEYRDVATETKWDPISNGGLGTVTQQVDQSGSFDVSEAYVEAIVPVFQSFELEAAYRIAKYNQPTVDNTSSWKFGASWQPIDDLRLRAMLATAERAPNTIELFSKGVGSQGPLVDPCDGVTATTTGTIAENCRSIPSVAANIADNGSFTRDITEQVQAPLSGNLRLREETAETLTVGIVLTPRAVEGLSVTMDYYDIEIDDAISQIDEQDTLFLCYQDPGFPNNDFCPQIVRDATTGELVVINRGVVNVNALRATGIDTSIRYAFDTDFLPGNFTFGLDHSYIDKLEQIFKGPQGQEVEVFAGEVPTPENRARGTLEWQDGPWMLRWKTQFWGEANDGAELANGSILSVDSHWKHDLYGSYDLELFGTETTIYGGINNLLDEDPPLLLDGSEYGDDFNTYTGYDIVGRFWYVGFGMNF